MKILVAEDEPISRELLAAYLTKWGHEVIASADGEQAWELLNAGEPPRLLLLDWMMPGIDGLELCRRIKGGEQSGQVYIILVTAKNRRQDIVAGLQAGADDYIVKPFDEDELQARVKVGVRIVELWQQLLETERLTVLAQTAGAAAHEINQPLSTLQALCQLMQLDSGLPEAQQARIERMRAAIDKISAIVLSMGAAEHYVTKHYVDGVDIIDFNPQSE